MRPESAETSVPTASITSSGPRAGAVQWVGLAVLALPTTLIALDLTVLYIALPHLVADLGATNTQLLWITDIYGFLIAGLLITMGTVGDRIGRRKLLLIGAAAFGAASVLAAYSTSPAMLIGTRALLGVAGATLMPSTLSLISTMFQDPRQRSLSIGLWVMSFSVGGALGPAIGGILLEHFWWGSVFLLGVPAMIALLLAGPILLPEQRSPEPGRLDLVSVALSLGAILPVAYGIKEIAKHRDLAAVPVLVLAAGLVAGLLFVRRQARLPDPLLDLRMFRSPHFSGAVAGILATTATLASVTLFYTQYLQLVEGLSPFRAGLWYLPVVVGTVLVSPTAPLLARRFRPAIVITIGLMIAIAGLVSLTRLDAGPGLALIVTGMVLFVIGSGPVMVLGTDLVVGSAPPEKAGSAAATSETAVELGAATGIATIGAAGAAAYSSAIAATVPDGVSSAAARAARDSFAGASAAAADLPDELAAMTVVAAQQAFVAGYHAVAAISAVLLLAVAMVMAIVLRRVRALGRGRG